MVKITAYKKIKEGIYEIHHNEHIDTMSEYHLVKNKVKRYLMNKTCPYCNKSDKIVVAKYRWCPLTYYECERFWCVIVAE